MSTASSDPIQNSTATSSKNKKKNKKKKSAAIKAEDAPNPSVPNGSSIPSTVDVEDDDDDDEDNDGGDAKPSIRVNPTSDTSQDTENPEESSPGASNGAKDLDSEEPSDTLRQPFDASERLESLAKERDRLRAEVIGLRKSLETIQGKHEEGISALQEQLDESQSGKDHAETQYRNLLGKVNTIKSQLGARMKENQQEIDQAQIRIEELEEQKDSLREANVTLGEDNSQLKKENEAQAKEVDYLRDRASLSQQNWVKERDEMVQRAASLLEQLDNAKEAMQDWEVVAMEERSIRENLGERVSVLEDQISTQSEAFEKAVAERDSYSSTVDGLQRALQDIQDARRKELREMVEHSQSSLDELRKQLQAAEDAAAASREELDETKKELERALPFEKQVKEQKLLIGKLQHNAVTLNDHLTKALRLLRKGKPEDNVDRQVVTNHLLHFLALDRSDPKKFQVLQLIASLLGWKDEQREQAGLTRPGTSSVASALRIPISPFRRTPSTPSLNADALLLTESSTSKESLAELWSNFLEQEAVEAGNISRRGSNATSISTTPIGTTPRSSSTPGDGGRPESGSGASPGLGIS